MLSPISPYELLCASRPKPNSSIVTAYDLYSKALNESHTPSIHHPASLSSEDAVFSQMPHAMKRTHYIADIHARHNAANRLQSTRRI